MMQCELLANLDSACYELTHLIDFNLFGKNTFQLNFRLNFVKKSLFTRFCFKAYCYNFILQCNFCAMTIAMYSCTVNWGLDELHKCVVR